MRTGAQANPRVVWLAFPPLTRTPQGPTSLVASVRYRMTIPARGLSHLGWSSVVASLASHPSRRALLARLAGANAVVIGKPLAASAAELGAAAERALEAIRELRARGVRVLADYSDDNFTDPLRGPIYRALANSADLVVASTAGLAEVLRSQTPVPVTTISDPVEGPRGEPGVAAPAGAAGPVSLLWFGHPVNLDTLRSGISQLDRAAGAVPYSLRLVTAPGAGAEALAAELADSWRGTARDCSFRPWSTAALFEELRECNAVVIPSNPHDPRKAVKSPNRFLESIWAGRFVIAHPLPAYQGLADCGWVGDDLGTGLRWFAERNADALERIRAGQSVVENLHTPHAIARDWAAAIAGTIAP